MKDKNKKELPKSSLYYRIIIGSTLLYIVGTLVESFNELSSNERIFGMIFIILFILIAAYLLITGIVAWNRYSKKNKRSSNSIEVDSDNLKDKE